MSETKKEKIDSMATINFSITKCPQKVYKKFVEFCKDESNDNYSFGLKLLLEGWNQNIKEVVLYEQYMLMEERVRQLEEQIKEKAEESKENSKTFGSSKIGVKSDE